MAFLYIKEKEEKIRFKFVWTPETVEQDARELVSHHHQGSEGDVGKVVGGAVVLQGKFQSRDAGPGVAPNGAAVRRGAGKLHAGPPHVPEVTKAVQIR